MQHSACLTTFLSAMLIGLNVISGSCIPKLIGRKFTSFVSCHFLSTPLFSLQLKTCYFYLAYSYTCEEALGSKVWWKNTTVEGERSIKAAEKDPSTTVVASVENMSLLPGLQLHVRRSAQKQSLMKKYYRWGREVLKQLKKILAQL